jgi:glycosyltransferase involved in cell wall biosynthesis
MPKLSIVIPVYNTEKYLKQCIDSVIGQTFTDFELILVDDGSTDGSGNICDVYAKEDSRVSVVHTKNQGVVTARRTGVALAKGEYIACVDSDDWLDLDFYRSLFELSNESDAEILVCSRVARRGGCIKTTAFAPGYYDEKSMEETV